MRPARDDQELLRPELREPLVRAFTGALVVTLAPCGALALPLALAAVCHVAWLAAGEPKGYHESDVLNPVLPLLAALGAAAPALVIGAFVGGGRRGAVRGAAVLIGSAIAYAGTDLSVSPSLVLPPWAAASLAALAAGVLGGVWLLGPSDPVAIAPPRV